MGYLVPKHRNPSGWMGWFGTFFCVLEASTAADARSYSRSLNLSQEVASQHTHPEWFFGWVCCLQLSAQTLLWGVRKWRQMDPIIAKPMEKLEENFRLKHLTKVFRALGENSSSFHFSVAMGFFSVVGYSYHCALESGACAVSVHFPPKPFPLSGRLGMESRCCRAGCPAIWMFFLKWIILEHTQRLNSYGGIFPYIWLFCLVNVAKYNIQTGYWTDTLLYF